MHLKQSLRPILILLNMTANCPLILVPKNMEKRIDEEKTGLKSEVAPEHINFSTDVLETISNELDAVQSEKSIPYQDIIKKFNADQNRVFLKIVSQLHKQYPAIKVPSEVCVSDSTDDPIFLFVSGVGGVGKSFLIKGLTAYIKQVFEMPVILMAPTGIAASNINGAPTF